MTDTEHRLRSHRHADLATAPDRDLLAACRTGDAHAWELLVARYERLAFHIARREGLDVEAASDVVQTTFSALLSSLDRLEDSDRVGAWLATVARRQSWRVRERGRREAPLIDDERQLDVPVDDPAIEQPMWVYQAVQQLGEPCRTLVTALFFDPAEPSYEDIASRLGRPVGSIGPVRARCLARLKTLLESDVEGVA